jgi:hypothetical protein
MRDQKTIAHLEPSNNGLLVLYGRDPYHHKLWHVYKHPCGMSFYAAAVGNNSQERNIVMPENGLL